MRDDSVERMTRDDAIDNDDHFKCRMCELSHWVEHSVVCQTCDERYCLDCYEAHSCVVEGA